MKSKYREAVLDCIDEFWRGNHYSPSIREIMGECGIPSTSHVLAILKSLRDDEEIELTDGKSRTIVPRWIVARIDT